MTKLTITTITIILLIVACVYHALVWSICKLGLRSSTVAAAKVDAVFPIK